MDRKEVEQQPRQTQREGKQRGESAEPREWGGFPFGSLDGEPSTSRADPQKSIADGKVAKMKVVPQRGQACQQDFPAKQCSGSQANDDKQPFEIRSQR